MHRRIVWSIAIVVVCSALVWAKKDFLMPRAESASTYPAHDQHPREKVTIAADPYDMPDKASIFTVKYDENELLPVYVIITNDGDQPVTLTNMEVTMKYRDRSKVAPATEDNILSRITHIKGRGGELPRTYPIPLPKKPKGGIPKGALDELDQAMFKVKAVEPHATRAGFMFFDYSGLSNPLAGATLYITGVRDNNGSELMYFEIPLEKYLSAQPSH